MLSRALNASWILGFACACIYGVIKFVILYEISTQQHISLLDAWSVFESVTRGTWSILDTLGITGIVLIIVGLVGGYVVDARRNSPVAVGVDIDSICASLSFERRARSVSQP